MSRRNARVSHGAVKVHLPDLPVSHVAVKVHHPPLPVSGARSAGGRGDVSVRMVVRIQRARTRAGDVAKVNVGEECGHRRVRGAVLSRRAEGRSCEKAHVKAQRGRGTVLCGCA